MLRKLFLFALLPLSAKISAQVINDRGSIIIQPGGMLTCNGNFTNAGTVEGTASIQGNLTNSGTLDPGSVPGITTVKGDYAATSTSIQLIRVGGIAADSYDQLKVDGQVKLNGTLTVSLVNGFTPLAANPDLPIITGSIQGKFTEINIPAQYQLVYNTNSVVLRSASTLPVTFINLDVKKEGSGARLTWLVQNETNLSRYEVERSNDGRRYSKVGEVKATAQNLYYFLDAPMEGKTYYRIKGVDLDAKYRYSIVTTYKQGISTVNLVAYPSLASGIVNIQHGTATAKSKIVIQAIDGRTVQTIVPATGAQLTSTDVSRFHNGTYIVRYFEGSGKAESVKFIKQ